MTEEKVGVVGFERSWWFGLKIWLVKGLVVLPLISGISKLVKYYNLASSYSGNLGKHQLPTCVGVWFFSKEV